MEYPPKLSVSTLVDSLKGASSRVLRRERPDTARKYWRGGDPDKALRFLRSMRGLVDLIGSEVYIDFESTARERLGDRDPEDWPILATALAIGCPIWTEDADFFGCGVPTWITSRVVVLSARALKVARNAQPSNLVGSELVGLATTWSFDNPSLRLKFCRQTGPGRSTRAGS